MRVDVTMTAKWPPCVGQCTSVAPFSTKFRTNFFGLRISFFFENSLFMNLFPGFREEHIGKAKRYLDTFLTDSSQKVLV